MTINDLLKVQAKQVISDQAEYQKIVKRVIAEQGVFNYDTLPAIMKEIQPFAKRQVEANLQLGLGWLFNGE